MLFDLLDQKTNEKKGKWTLLCRICCLGKFFQLKVRKGLCISFCMSYIAQLDFSIQPKNKSTMIGSSGWSLGRNRANIRLKGPPISKQDQLLLSEAEKNSFERIFNKKVFKKEKGFKHPSELRWVDVEYLGQWSSNWRENGKFSYQRCRFVVRVRIEYIYSAKAVDPTQMNEVQVFQIEICSPRQRLSCRKHKNDHPLWELLTALLRHLQPLPPMKL